MDTVRENCIFCRIADHDIASNLLYEDERIVAFPDLHPQAPVHILIICKRHIASLAELTDADGDLVGQMLLVARSLAEQAGIADSGYRLICNCRADSGQEVPHLHFHLLGGEKLGPLLAR
jgi:histidine triad (HIT) family protein